jgi:SAM-dependent methyltransferase
MTESFWEAFKGYIGETNLNLGCGEDYIEGWENVDFSQKSKADFNFDFRGSPWMMEDDKYDTVLASHVLEHFTQDELFPIMFEIGRVLKPGGNLIGVVPYGMSACHYANPFHRFGWTEETMFQFDRTLYETKGTASTNASQMIPLQSWAVTHVTLTPFPEWFEKGSEELSFAVKHYTNVIKEMQFVLKVRKDG